MDSVHISYYTVFSKEFILGSYQGKLCLLDFSHRTKKDMIHNRIKKNICANFVRKEDEIIKETKKQLDSYFENKRKSFNIPLLTTGTSFQKKVWEQLLQIPYGETITYKDLATMIGDEKSFRAVANANGANAIGIIIPCHRVIASDGTLGGYAGGVDIKEKLLQLEKNII